MPTPTWLTVVLIILCLLSLVGVGWCLLFMAPLEKFRKHVNSLGGGMKGIEEHLAEVSTEIHGRLAGLEESSRQKIGETRENVEASLSKLAEDASQFRADLEALGREVAQLRTEHEAAATNGARAIQSLDAVTKQLARLRSDFESLDVELRESVRQLVGESFSTVESTVLSALDAVQEEIVYGISEPTGRSPRFRPRQTDPRPPSPHSRPTGRSRDNIISVAPLFAGLPRQGTDGELPDEGSADTSGEGGETDGGGDGAGS
jgi:outer membrane murein-binding lipoprotein Lpp